MRVELAGDSVESAGTGFSTVGAGGALIMVRGDWGLVAGGAGPGRGSQDAGGVWIDPDGHVHHEIAGVGLSVKSAFSVARLAVTETLLSERAG